MIAAYSFRLTHFVECEASDEAVYATTCDGTFTEPQQAIRGADDCDASKGPGTRVIINSALSSDKEDCNPRTGGITIAQSDTVISYKDGMFSPSALSHELGHKLGLPHASDDSHNLMHPTNQTGTVLTAGQCATAYSNALWFQQSVWP